MRSVRLDPELEARLQEASRSTGRPVSQIIREAVRQWCDKWCDEWRGERLDRRLADVIGVADSGGGNSRQTGHDFTESVDEEERRKRRGAG